MKKTNLHFCILIALCSITTACAKEKTPRASHQGRPEATMNDVQLTDCAYQFKPSGICLTYAWEKLPTETTMGSFIFKTVRVGDSSSEVTPVSLSPKPQVVIWMPAMGHGSSPTTMTELEPGVYRVTNVFFVMPGNWEIRFEVGNATAISDEAIVPYTY